MNGRKYLVSANGYIGLVHEAAQERDMMSIFLRGMTPFIIRPAGENYKLMGSCYVHGTMHCEALKKFERIARSARSARSAGLYPGLRSVPPTFGPGKQQVQFADNDLACSCGFSGLPVCATATGALGAVSAASVDACIASCGFTSWLYYVQLGFIV